MSTLTLSVCAATNSATSCSAVGEHQIRSVASQDGDNEARHTRIARKRRHVWRPTTRQPNLESRVLEVFARHCTASTRGRCCGRGCSGRRSRDGGRSVDDRSALSKRLFARCFLGARFLVCLDLSTNSRPGFRVLDLVYTRVVQRSRWEGESGRTLPRRLCSASLTISFAFNSSLILFMS